MSKRRMAVLVGMVVRVCEVWSSAGGCVCHVLSLLLPLLSSFVCKSSCRQGVDIEADYVSRIPGLISLLSI